MELFVFLVAYAASAIVAAHVSAASRALPSTMLQQGEVLSLGLCIFPSLFSLISFSQCGPPP